VCSLFFPTIPEERSPCVAYPTPRSRFFPNYHPRDYFPLVEGFLAALSPQKSRWMTDLHPEIGDGRCPPSPPFVSFFPRLTLISASCLLLHFAPEIGFRYASSPFLDPRGGDAAEEEQIPPRPQRGLLNVSLFFSLDSGRGSSA